MSLGYVQLIGEGTRPAPSGAVAQMESTSSSADGEWTTCNRGASPAIRPSSTSAGAGMLALTRGPTV